MHSVETHQTRDDGILSISALVRRCHHESFFSVTSTVGDMAEILLQLNELRAQQETGVVTCLPEHDPHSSTLTRVHVIALVKDSTLCIRPYD